MTEILKILNVREENTNALPGLRDPDPLDRIRGGASLESARWCFGDSEEDDSWWIEHR